MLKERTNCIGTSEAWEETSDNSSSKGKHAKGEHAYTNMLKWAIPTRRGGAWTVNSLTSLMGTNPFSPSGRLTVRPLELMLKMQPQSLDPTVRFLNLRSSTNLGIRPSDASRVNARSSSSSSSCSDRQIWVRWSLIVNYLHQSCTPSSLSYCWGFCHLRLCD